MEVTDAGARRRIEDQHSPDPAIMSQTLAPAGIERQDTHCQRQNAEKPKDETKFTKS